jgi:hypothetical protein
LERPEFHSWVWVGDEVVFDGYLVRFDRSVFCGRRLHRRKEDHIRPRQHIIERATAASWAITLTAHCNNSRHKENQGEGYSHDG